MRTSFITIFFSCMAISYAYGMSRQDHDARERQYIAARKLMERPVVIVGSPARVLIDFPSDELLQELASVVRCSQRWYHFVWDEMSASYVSSDKEQIRLSYEASSALYASLQKYKHHTADFILSRSSKDFWLLVPETSYADYCEKACECACNCLCWMCTSCVLLCTFLYHLVGK